MERDRKKESDEIALFKGHYLEKFLTLEFAIEGIIIQFFSDHYNGKSKRKKGIAEKENEQKENFFTHFLFIDSGFTFNSKLEGAKTIMQISNPDFFKAVSQKNKNLFNLIQHLNELRNIIAHTPAEYRDNTIVGSKAVRKFMGKQIKKIDAKTGKSNIIDVFEFVPVNNEYFISKEIRESLSFQLRSSMMILAIYAMEFPKFKGAKDGGKQMKDLLNIVKASSEESKLYGDVGVFRLFKEKKG